MASSQPASPAWLCFGMIALCVGGLLLLLEGSLPQPEAWMRVIGALSLGGGLAGVLFYAVER